MEPCEFVTFISALACTISKNKSTDEISLLAAFFTQLGDTLATIATINSNKKIKKLHCVTSFHLISFYSSQGAPTGQTPSQVPQDIHADASITNLSSPCEIHPTGHSAAQAPHDIHLSVILYATLVTSFTLILYILISIFFIFFF